MCFFDDKVSTSILKAKNRIIKEITQLKFFNYYQEKSYQNHLLNYSDALAEIPSYYDDLELQLNERGIYVTHIDQLSIDNSEEFTNSCLKVLQSFPTKQIVSKNNYFLLAEPQKIIEHPEIYTWGLNEKLIATVSRYLKLPVAYHGSYLRRDIANNVIRKSRLWHLDKEDRRMIKIIIYLNDVDEKSGAFQYISKSFTSDLIRQLRYNNKYLPAQKIERFLPISEWTACEGKTGTVIFVDTANIFHRGLVPQTTDRWSVFFDYTSAFPLRPYYCKSCFPLQDLLKFASILSSEQKEYVFWNRKLKQALQEFEADI